MDEKQNVVIYQNEAGDIKLDVFLENETVWLTQEQMSLLFGKARRTIGEHIQNVFDENELDPKVVRRNFRHTTNHGALEGKTQTQNVYFYNLDVIISVGYRVKSPQGTKFRMWATKRLREYIIKGFTMDDDRLKGAVGGTYWKELLNRIRDIRSSEKVLYRQVLDLYATSTDFDPESKESKLFFATVQNKLHYAVNMQTAPELIYSRADAEKEFMGLTSFSGTIPIQKDISIAKNYLNESELQRLNRLVSAFFDLAELHALEHKEMRMQDWVNELDKFTQAYGRGKLPDAGKVSHKEAMDKAEGEYRKYQVKTLSPVEKAYFANIRQIVVKIPRKIRS